MPYICAETSIYRFILGLAAMYFMCSGISKTRQRFFTPKAFIAGEMARVMAPLPREISQTARLALNGSSPRSTHSTEAKKLFRSMQIYAFRSTVHHSHRTFCTKMTYYAAKGDYLASKGGNLPRFTTTASFRRIRRISAVAII